MKILFVINNAYTSGNGLATSCRRTVNELKQAGEDVRLLSAVGPSGEEPDYILKGETLPVFGRLVKKQGYAFAKIDDETIREAVKWADVVHLEEPFDLEIRTLKIAKEEKKPVTATYHLHPENFYSSIHLRRSKYLNCMTMLVWMKTIFNQCDVVQCPTENVKKRLERWHCKAKLIVISNGMILDKTDQIAAPIKKDSGEYIIITTGRFSVEKDQITLLKAMKYSKYADKIQLVFAGRGPLEKKLQHEADKLLKRGIITKKPIFQFYDFSNLQAIYQNADLYVHCAIVEVEGMSCMEAIQTGLVPIIATHKLSSTAQFAINERNLFKAHKARELAERIDYWLSDELRRKTEAEKYMNIGIDYDISKSVERLQKMFIDLI